LGGLGSSSPVAWGGALAVVRDAQAELGFELELVDIDGDPELEAHYREHLPVIEIDGARASPTSSSQARSALDSVRSRRGRISRWT
jgi:hypothetical protein